MDSLRQDLRYSLRAMRRSPGFTAIAVLTLALGIGANTAIFSVVDALILNPPHIADADRVATIWRSPKDKQRGERYLSYLELQDWRTQSRSFASIAGYKTSGFVLLHEDGAERVLAMRVTANFLALLKVRVLRGRDFQVEEEKRGAPPVVIISHAFWQDRLGGDEAALGQPLVLDSKAFTIIGILPRGFEFPLGPRPMELLTTIAGEEGNLDERGAHVLKAVGRLKPGVTFPQAQAEMTGIAANLEKQYPQYERDITVYVVPAEEQIVGHEVRRALWVLLGAVGFLLLIACTNVTNLLLVRASNRQKELSLRVALGAGTWRIARHLLTESLLLALFSGGAGLLLAAWGLDVIRYYGAGQLPRLDEVQINAAVLGFTVAVSVLTVLLVGLLPVLHAARPDVSEVLKAGAKTVAGGRALRWWRDSLVVTEVALGLVLLIGAGLMMRSFHLLVNVPPGFDPQNVLVGRISLTRAAYEDPAEVVRYVNETLGRLKALPGVESAAFVAPMPFSGGDVSSSFRIDEFPKPEPGETPSAHLRSVTPQYFQAIRIPLQRGRAFTEQDRRDGAGVAIINEALARLYFPNEDPLGKHISHVGANQNEGDPERWEIVGIIGNVHHNNLTDAATPEIYLPFLQNSWNWGNFFVRTTNDPAALASSFAEAIRTGDKTVPITRVQLLTQAISGTVAQTRFYTLLFVLFGVTGLVLTLTGIYGVTSHSVAQRTPEIGIRMALGAQASDVLRLFLGHGLLLTIAGVLLGVAGAGAVTHWIADLLFRVDATDPSTFVWIALLVATVALLACYVPARRATRVDPMVALRYE